MSETMDIDEVERRVGETLRAKAAQLVVGHADFDAQLTPLSEMTAVSARRPRRVLAFATAIAVAAAASGVVIVTRPTRVRMVSSASAVIDGKWYIFGASRFVMSFVHRTSHSAFAHPPFPSGPPLSTQRGTIDGVQVAVVVVPAGTDTVTLEETTNSKTGVVDDLTRPAS
jgi:hypothetical protein